MKKRFSDFLIPAVVTLISISGALGQNHEDSNTQEQETTSSAFDGNLILDRITERDGNQVILSSNLRLTHQRSDGTILSSVSIHLSIPGRSYFNLTAYRGDGTCGEYIIAARLVPHENKVLLFYKNYRVVLLSYNSEGRANVLYDYDYLEYPHSIGSNCEYAEPSFNQGQELISSFDFHQRLIRLSSGVSIPMDGFSRVCTRMEQSMIEIWSNLRNQVHAYDQWTLPYLLNVSFSIHQFESGLSFSDVQEFRNNLSAESLLLFMSQHGFIFPQFRGPQRLSTEGPIVSIDDTSFFIKIYADIGTYHYERKLKFEIVSLGESRGFSNRIIIDTIQSALSDSEVRPISSLSVQPIPTWLARFSWPINFMNETYRNDNLWNSFLSTTNPELEKISRYSTYFGRNRLRDFCIDRLNSVAF